MNFDRTLQNLLFLCVHPWKNTWFITLTLFHTLASQKMLCSFHQTWSYTCQHWKLQNCISIPNKIYFWEKKMYFTFPSLYFASFKDVYCIPVFPRNVGTTYRKTVLFGRSTFPRELRASSKIAYLIILSLWATTPVYT